MSNYIIARAVVHSGIINLPLCHVVHIFQPQVPVKKHDQFCS